MEFNIEAGELARTLGLVKGIIPTRTTIPVLTHVKLVASGSRLAVTANSLDMLATVNVDCECPRSGEITVPGQTLLGLAKSLPKDKTVTVKIEDNRALISCGRSKYNLPTLPAGDFPDMVDGDATASTFMMAAEALKEALEATRPTVSTEETRYYLCGVAACVEGDRLAFVSTDGHRLSRITSEMPDGANNLSKAIIPSMAVSQIMNLCGAVDGEAEIKVSENRISVSLGDVIFKSKLIAGTYPDYERVIPGKKKRSFIVNSDDVAEAIGRLLSVTNKPEPVAVFKTNGAAVDIRLGRSCDEQGSETIDANISSASEFGVNARYVADMISLWPPSTDLEFQSNDPSDPILITSDAVPGQTQVVMPMRI